MAGRDVEITDGGNLKLYKSGTASPTDSVSINAPADSASPTGSYALTMPAGLTANAYLKSPASGGQLAWNTDEIGFNWINIGAQAGADPTGATDNSSQMLAALEAAQNGDHTVFIPDGTFAVKNIDFDAGDLATGDRKFCIVGADPQSSKLTVGLDADASSTELFEADGTTLDYLELRNLTIDGKFLKSTGAYRGHGKIINVKVKELVIDNCTFTNIGGTDCPALAIADITNSAHITNSRFTELNPAAATQQPPECIVFENTLSAPAAGSAWPNVVISGNQFDCKAPASNSGAGAVAIWADWTNGYERSLVIENNYFNNCGANVTAGLAPAIDLVRGAHGAIVRDNVFHACLLYTSDAAAE